MISIPDYVELRYVTNDACGRPWHGFVASWSYGRMTKQELETAVAAGVSPEYAIVARSVYLVWYRRDPFTQDKDPEIPAVKVAPHRAALSMAETLSKVPDAAGAVKVRIFVTDKDMETICSKLAAEIETERNRILGIKRTSLIAARPTICSDCHGKKVYEGLIFDRYDCPTCNGTGKVHQ